MMEIKGFIWDDSLTVSLFGCGVALFGFIIGLRSCDWRDIFTSNNRLLQSFYRLLAVEIIVTLLINVAPTISPEWADVIDKLASWCFGLLIFSIAGIVVFFACWTIAKTIRWIIGI